MGALLSVLCARIHVANNRSSIFIIGQRSRINGRGIQRYVGLGSPGENTKLKLSSHAELSYEGPQAG